MTILRPFFRHYGSKWGLSKKTSPPRYGKIIEPFCGAAGYSSRYGANLEVRLFDSVPDVVAIWDWILGASEEDVLSLPVDFGDADIRSLGLERGPLLLIQRWLTMQGSTNNWRFPPSSLAYINRNPGSYWTAQIRGRIAGQLRSVKRWGVQCLDYSQVPDEEATWHIDPMYQGNLRSDSYGADDLDYDVLADWCRSRSGQVMVHEQDGATWLPFRSLSEKARTGHISNKTVKNQHEVIWTNQNLDEWG